MRTRKFLRSYPFFLLLALLIGNSLLNAQDISERIDLAPGPEDMVLDTMGPEDRLLVSCCARRDEELPYGEILSYFPGSMEKKVLPRLNEPGGIVFRPHGIYLDKDTLYVISHEKEPNYHPVLSYLVKDDHLEYLETIHSDMMHSPNALVKGEGGTLYLVNDSGKRGSIMEKALKMKKASVVKLEKNADGEWEAELAAEKLGYPIGINRIGDMLYVSDAIQNKIHVYRISDDGLLPEGELGKLKGSDNIRIYQGSLLTCAHVKPLRFMSHAKKSGKKSPVTVFRVQPETGTIQDLYSNSGSTISGGSTAIIYGDYLYISQVFEPYLVRVLLGNE